MIFPSFSKYIQKQFNLHIYTYKHKIWINCQCKNWRLISYITCTVLALDSATNGFRHLCLQFMVLDIHTFSASPVVWILVSQREPHKVTSYSVIQPPEINRNLPPPKWTSNSKLTETHRNQTSLLQTFIEVNSLMTASIIFVCLVISS